MVHCRGCPGPDSDDHVLGPRVQEALDRGLGFAETLGGDGAGGIVLRVRVAVQLQHAAHEVFNECHTPARGGVVGVGDPPAAERRVDLRILPDDARARKIPEICPGPGSLLLHIHLPVRMNVA